MIKRFEAVCSCSEPDMRESEFGGYASFDDHIATIAAKDAEIAKLREALSSILGYDRNFYDNGRPGYEAIARAALEGGEA